MNVCERSFANTWTCLYFNVSDVYAFAHRIVLPIGIFLTIVIINRTSEKILQLPGSFKSRNNRQHHSATSRAHFQRLRTARAAKRRSIKVNLTRDCLKTTFYKTPLNDGHYSPGEQAHDIDTTPTSAKHRHRHNTNTDNVSPRRDNPGESELIPVSAESLIWPAIKSNYLGGIASMTFRPRLVVFFGGESFLCSMNTGLPIYVVDMFHVNGKRVKKDY